MARKPKDQKPDQFIVTDTDTPGLPAMSAAADLQATLQANYDDERDFVNQLIGRSQMANAIARFSDVVNLNTLRNIKDNKLYRALRGKRGVDTAGEEIADIGTWDGFCRALRLSRSKVDEDLANLCEFGEVALKNLSDVGTGYRELRQLRKLPEDQKTALIEAAKSGDKDVLLELAEDLIIKHAGEKDALSKKLTETTADLEASREIAAKRTEEVNSLQEQLHKRKRTSEWPQIVNDINLEITVLGNQVTEACDRLAGMADVIQQEDFGGEAKEAATEKTGACYYDTMSFIAGRVGELMDMCEDLFGLYKHNARPALAIMEELGVGTGD